MAESATAIFLNRAQGATSPNPSAELSAFLKPSAPVGPEIFAALADRNRAIVEGLRSPQLNPRALRTNVYLVSKTLSKLDDSHRLGTATEAAAANQYRAEL